MTTGTILAIIGGLLLLAFLANRLFRLTRVPDVVVLMAAGVVVGPVLHWVNAAQFQRFTHVLGTLAIVLVLFEGGLELDIRPALRHFGGGALLAVLSFCLTAGGVALATMKLMGVGMAPALLVGAVLGCTSSTIVLPVLQQMESRQPLKITLIMESTLGDVLAVLSVGILLHLSSQHGSVVRGIIHGLLAYMVMSLLLAFAAGVLWSRLVPVLAERQFWHVATFAMVLLLYTGTEVLGGNGLVAVLGFGLTLANFPGIDPALKEFELAPASGETAHSSALLSFHSELAFLVRTFFFVLLGAVAEVGNIVHEIPLLAAILAALLVARWLATETSSLSWSGINLAERRLAFWLCPRGLITAVLAIEVLNARGKQMEFLPTLAFATILATNFLMVFGSIHAGARARSPHLAAAEAATPSALRRRWIFDLALLLMLVLGALAVWMVGVHPQWMERARTMLHPAAARVEHWVGR